ncbi:MAG: nitrogenase cofactor biosynthesis protein NifB [Bacillota bacterium]
MNGALRKVKVRLMNEALEETGRHPCYSYGAHHRYARMHLPVAPLCNISCNYCNRQYDCLHESRPGVTSEVLTPDLALEKFKQVRQKIERLSVVGIAGPGDALANWESTGQTLKLIRQADPGVIFCLSTNGLMLPHRAREIVELGVRHVTVTVNCTDPAVGQKIYGHVRYQGRKYEGAGGAGLLIENQMAGIKDLVRYGAVVKVNIVMIKGINDFHIPEIVTKLKGLGVFITNIMPLIPARGSLFENYPQTGQGELNKMRGICQAHLRQMYHCRQCRADAIGLLDNDRSSEFRTAVSGTEMTGLQEAGPQARAV